MCGSITGTLIDEEVWEASGNPSPFDQLEDKSSKYWIEIPYLNDEIIKSEIKQFHKDFQKEELIGKTDFNIWLWKDLEISNELWDYLSWNVWISLYESKPIIIKEKDTSPGALETAEIWKVVLEDGKPKFETNLLGWLRVRTDEWVFNPLVKNDQMLSYQKQYFYKEKYVMRPEFKLPNCTTKLKNKEIEQLDKYVKEKLERKA